MSNAVGVGDVVSAAGRLRVHAARAALLQLHGVQDLLEAGVLQREGQILYRVLRIKCLFACDL